MKKLILELQLSQSRPGPTIRASAMDVNIGSRDLDELRERMTLSEIKVNDVEQRLSLLLRARKGGRAGNK